MKFCWQKNIFPQGIYIHWPFCKNKCHYCDFISFAKHDDFINEYHQALMEEITFFSNYLDNNIKKTVKTIFLGGGSPSLCPLESLKELVEILNNKFDLSCLKEFTIECNPADVTEEKLKTWRKLGINRLSLGIQVLDDEVLQNLGRTQKTQDVLNLMTIASKYFDNISVDLILGLPGVNNLIWFNTLKTIASWPVNHVSVYFLTVYEKTKLYFRVKSGEIILPSEKENIFLYKKSIDFLRKHGFEQYEISNFAKSGFRSIHNIAYWDREPYKGFGLSASSFDGKRRFINYKNLPLYVKNSSTGATFNVEDLTKEQEYLETLMLGLRQNKGVGLQHMLYLLKNSSFKNKFLENIKFLESEGLVKTDGKNIQLTLKGMFLENEVVLNLMQ
ncbi:MAG: radical SAM family heme chaperone HemW [bacterium]